MRMPLHDTARKGDAEAVAALLAAGAKADAIDIFRRTPLYQAARYGHLEVISVLLRVGTDPNAKDGSRRTCPPCLDTQPGGALFCQQPTLQRLRQAPEDAHVEEGVRVFVRCGARP